MKVLWMRMQASKLKRMYGRVHRSLASCAPKGQKSTTVVRSILLLFCLVLFLFVMIRVMGSKKKVPMVSHQTINPPPVIEHKEQQAPLTAPISTLSATTPIATSPITSSTTSATSTTSTLTPTPTPNPNPTKPTTPPPTPPTPPPTTTDKSTKPPLSPPPAASKPKPQPKQAIHYILGSDVASYEKNHKKYLLYATKNNFKQIASLYHAILQSRREKEGVESQLPIEVFLYGYNLSVDHISWISVWKNVSYIQMKDSEVVYQYEEDLENQLTTKQIHDIVLSCAQSDFPGVTFANPSPTVDSILDIESKDVSQLYEQTMAQSKNFPKFSSLSLPIQEKVFAIVVSIKLQDPIHRLMETLSLWNKYPLCSSSALSVPTDIIFMLAGKERSKDIEDKILLRIQKSLPCLNEIYFYYPTQLASTVKEILSLPHVYNNYRYIFLTNYLVEPIRKNWLQRLIDLSFDDPSPFWRKGSLNRAKQGNGGDALSISYLALHSTSFDYRHFLMDKFEKHHDVWNFDKSLFKYMSEESEFRDLLHNFKYDDYIIDLVGMTEYNIPEIRTENPYTQLLIGK